MVGEPTTTHTGGEPWQVHLARIGVGIVAGAVVALVKYAGDDSDVAARIAEGNFGALLLRMVGYAILPIILGAVGGWISDERKVHKIFWIAISAPIIIAAAAGASNSHPPQALPVGKAGWNLEQILPVTSAYANEIFAADRDPGSVPSGAATKSENPFIQGLNLFLGIGRDQTHYRLVVHSVLNDKDKAEAIAKRLNREYQLPAPATVGNRKPGNPYWPIVLNGWTTYADAKRLKDGIRNMNFGFDSDDSPYISVDDR